jgi:hypothetical protein
MRFITAKISARAAAIFSVTVLFLMFPGCEAEKAATTANPSQENYDLAAELKLLNETFRIDIDTIQVIYDFYPDQLLVRGAASVSFKMRSGQTRPLIHFDPGWRDGAIDSIILDGEMLSYSNSNDVRVREFSGTIQKAIEFQRDLAPNNLHRLDISFHLNIEGNYPRFVSEVEDGMGRGNEELFPTINTPHELARHQLTFRIHGGKLYEMVGSGIVDSSTAGDVQTWTLDTLRPISSYTVLFALMPKADVDVGERVINGTPVKIMTYKGTASIADAFTQLESWLPQLAADFGPYPSPRIGVFLVRSGGMEYYGGTICAPSALKHEIFHNYFGCSLIARTFRDSWWDEGMASWYVDYSKGTNVSPVAEDFYSNVVSGRSPIALGWDERSYEVGRKILQYIGQRIGGATAVTGYLRHLYETRLFSPFNAMEMADDLKAYSGLDLHSQFLRWLYSHENGPAVPTASSQTVNLSPPTEILQKYQTGER